MRCPDLSERERLLVTGMSLTVISKFLHSAIANIRAKAIVNRAEALTDAHLLHNLFDLPNAKCAGRSATKALNDGATHSLVQAL